MEIKLQGLLEETPREEAYDYVTNVVMKQGYFLSDMELWQAYKSMSFKNPLSMEHFKILIQSMKDALKQGEPMKTEVKHSPTPFCKKHNSEHLASMCKTLFVPLKLMPGTYADNIHLKVVPADHNNSAYLMVGGKQKKEFAAFIVKAVNSHEALVEALKNIRELQSSKDYQHVKEAMVRNMVDNVLKLAGE